jgi:hypothetical protein
MEGGMIPNWQWAGLVILVLLALAMGITSAPNSYAYLYLTGRCQHDPMPVACHPAPRRPAFLRTTQP